MVIAPPTRIFRVQNCRVPNRLWIIMVYLQSILAALGMETEGSHFEMTRRTVEDIAILVG